VCSKRWLMMDPIRLMMYPVTRNCPQPGEGPGVHGFPAQALVGQGVWGSKMGPPHLKIRLDQSGTQDGRAAGFGGCPVPLESPFALVLSAGSFALVGIM